MLGILEGAYLVIYHGYLKSFYRKRPEIVLPKVTPPIKAFERFEKEEETIEELSQTPLILSSFITSTIKIFSFLDKETLTHIADNSEVVELDQDSKLSINFGNDFYLLIDGELKYIDPNGIELLVTGPSAISSLFHVLANMAEVDGCEGLNYEYIVIKRSKFIRVKREALLKIKTQAVHLIRIILTRFKRVTIPLCKKYLVNFLPELSQIASKSIYTISDQVRKQRFEDND